MVRNGTYHDLQIIVELIKQVKVLTTFIVDHTNMSTFDEVWQIYFTFVRFKARRLIHTLTSLSRQCNGMERTDAMALKQFRNCEILT